MSKIKMQVVSDDEYHSQDNALQLKREYGKTPNGNPMSGRWVLRDAAGTLLDFARYFNDIAERHGLQLA